MNVLCRLFGGHKPLVDREGSPPERERRDLRAAGLPPGYRRLIQGAAVDVVGESHYRAKIERFVGRRAEGHKDIVDAVLLWEPTNKYDPNAVAVQIGGQTCGYLSEGDAKRYRPVLERCLAERFVPVVRGDISGGFREPGGTWAHFGVKIYVASPEKLADQFGSSNETEVP